MNKDFLTNDETLQDELDDKHAIYNLQQENAELREVLRRCLKHLTNGAYSVSNPTLVTAIEKVLNTRKS